MADLQARKRVAAWGNAFGIRLTKADLARLGVHATDEVEVIIRAKPKGLDVSKLRFLHLGEDASARHEDDAGQAVLDDLERTNPTRPGRREGRRGRH